MANSEDTQELLLLALAAPPDLPETTLYKLRELARLPLAKWDRYLRHAPDEGALVSLLCQEYAAAHPDELQSRRARAIAASLEVSALLGRTIRDVGPAPTAEQLEALEDFHAGLEKGVIGLRTELGLAERIPPRVRAPRPRKVHLETVLARPANAASQRKAAQLVTAYICAGRLEYPEEAYQWMKLRMHLSRQIVGPGGHAQALGRALRVAFYPADQAQEEPETPISLAPQDEPAALARLAAWADELLPRPPEEFAWPGGEGTDWLELILRKLSLFDLLAARGVSVAWAVTGQAPLRQALREQIGLAAWLKTAPRYEELPRWRRGPVPLPPATATQARIVRWHRRAYGTSGPHLVRYIARLEGARLGQKVVRALEDVPRASTTSMLAPAWERLEADLCRLAERAAEKLWELFGEAGAAPPESEADAAPPEGASSGASDGSGAEGPSRG